jgi:hypothetical protein
MVAGLPIKAIPPTATAHPLAPRPLLSTRQVTEMIFCKTVLQDGSRPLLLRHPISSPTQAKASLIKTFSMPRATWEWHLLQTLHNPSLIR